VPTKLLIVSDSVTGPTGLGRIARELALHIHKYLADEFEVATYGFNAVVSRKLPFQQFKMEANGTVPTNFPEVWDYFAGDEHGICLTVWNQSWLSWLSHPESVEDPALKKFLLKKPFDTWGYFPIDGDMIGGRLCKHLGSIMYGFDRIAAYTQYGKRVIEASRPAKSPEKEIAVLPHGLDTRIFYPRDRAEARATFGKRVTGMNLSPLADEVFMVGCLATNTPRKDFYLAFEVILELRRRDVSAALWIHADKIQAYWDLLMMAEEFGLDGSVIASRRLLTDEDLAWAYSACDATLGIGSGEGWGLPLSESLACGIPCIHGNYAGGAEFIPKQFLVEPVGFHGEGAFAIRRPVFRASDWADVVLGANKEDAILPDYIPWPNAFELWKTWLLEGVK
jgi:glycosyltransferase involved in cell wall biosynthesis